VEKNCSQEHDDPKTDNTATDFHAYKIRLSVLVSCSIFEIRSKVSSHFLNSIYVAIVRELSLNSATCVSKLSTQTQPIKLLEFQHLVLSFVGICREQECVCVSDSVAE